MKDLTLTTSYPEEMQIIESWIRSRRTNGRSLEILEAGCGQKWDVDLADLEFHLTGVDLDQAALDLRLTGSIDLHEAVQGDLREVQLDPDTFDVIYNSYVLEHVNGATKVLENFRSWLKVGGIVIIRIPDPLSVYGFISRVTPHWFHVLYYRRVMGIPEAGQPGYAPYPVHYDEIVSRAGLHRFCRENGLALRAEYGTGCYFHPGRGLVRRALPIFKTVLSVLSLGRLSASHNDLLFVIEKTEA